MDNESTEGTAHHVERIISALPLQQPGYPTGYHGGTDPLYDMTMQGWEVVERFEIDEPITVREASVPAQQNGYQPNPIVLEHTQLGKQSYLRLRKSGDAIVCELNDQIVKLKSDNYNATGKLTELQKEIEKLKADSVQVQSRLKGSQDNYEALRKQKEQIEQIKRQLEGDIGKIREHIGRKMMDEILVKKEP